MTLVPEISAKTDTRKPVPVSDASDMQFGIEFFWYQFLVNKMYFRASFWSG